MIPSLISSAVGFFFLSENQHVRLQQNIWALAAPCCWDVVLQVSHWDMSQEMLFETRTFVQTSCIHRGSQ